MVLVSIYFLPNAFIAISKRSHKTRKSILLQIYISYHWNVFDQIDK